MPRALVNGVARLALLVALPGVGCRGEPSDGARDSLRASGIASSKVEEEAATVDPCGRGFQGQVITPPGEVLQRETVQATACADESCGRRTAAMMFVRHFAGTTCEEVRENIAGKPIMDAWGAQVRVICDGQVAHAISGGRDG
jgi:hypothetical protein